MTGQSRLMSWVETLTGTAIGYSVALVSQIAVFPLFGIHIPLSSNIGIGLIFTVISIVRGFCVRRLFNWLHLRRA